MHRHRIQSTQIGEMTSHVFNRQHVIPGLPLLMHNAIVKWGANNWNRQYLQDLLGSKIVRVAFNRRSIFNYSESASTGVVKQFSLPFQEALELIYSTQGSNYYINQQSIMDQFPELLPDIRRPELLDTWKVIDVTNIWIGGAGCMTPLHYDRTHNFLVQVSGIKHVTLFAPIETENLYPALETAMSHCSLVNVFEPNYSAHPRYATAVPNMLSCELAPGDALFIPNGWWHAVVSREPSISLNFWWHSLI